MAIACAAVAPRIGGERENVTFDAAEAEERVVPKRVGATEYAARI